MRVPRGERAKDRTEQQAEQSRYTTKKNTMKTKSNNKQTENRTAVSGLSFRPEQSSGNSQHQQQTAHGKRPRPYVNFEQREANRTLPTDEVLGMLREWLPQAYELAEVVGKWVWVTFPEQPAEQLRGQLSQFGFHWNNIRKCWQHPCGQFSTGSNQDPREKYGSHMATAARTANDLQAA